MGGRLVGDPVVGVTRRMDARVLKRLSIMIASQVVFSADLARFFTNLRSCGTGRARHPFP